MFVEDLAQNHKNPKELTRVQKVMKTKEVRINDFYSFYLEIFSDLLWIYLNIYPFLEKISLALINLQCLAQVFLVPKQRF